MTLEPRTGDSISTVLGLQFGGLSRAATQQSRQAQVTTPLTPQDAYGLTHQSNRITLDHGEGIEEWYVNTAQGLEHGFNLAKKPFGSGLLNLSINVTEGQATMSGDNIRFNLANGRQMLYQHLSVLDANK